MPSLPSPRLYGSKPDFHPGPGPGHKITHYILLFYLHLLDLAIGRSDRSAVSVSESISNLLSPFPSLSISLKLSSISYCRGPFHCRRPIEAATADSSDFAAPQVVEKSRDKPAVLPPDKMAQLGMSHGRADGLTSKIERDMVLWATEGSNLESRFKETEETEYDAFVKAQLATRATYEAKKHSLGAKLSPQDAQELSAITESAATADLERLRHEYEARKDKRAKRHAEDIKAHHDRFRALVSLSLVSISPTTTHILVFPRTCLTLLLLAR